MSPRSTPPKPPAAAGAERPAARPPPPKPPNIPPGVVLLALLGVGERVVGALDLLELLLRLRVVGVAVRVVLARQLAVRLLDLLVGGLLGDAEHLVEILGHARPYSLTTTRAGRISCSPSR